MTALAIERLTKFGGLYPAHGNFPIEANTRVFKGAQVGLNAAGNVIPAQANTCLIVLGKATATYNNLTGSPDYSGLAGAVMVEVEYGIFGWDSVSSPAADVITQAQLPCTVYALDDHTVTFTSQQGTLPLAGLATEITTDPNTAAQKIMVFQGPITAGFLASGLQKRSLTVGFAQLTAAALTMAFNLDQVVPANARIIGYSIDLATPFTGGAIATMTVSIGSAGDPAALVAGANVLAAAVDGQASTLPLGKAPHRLYTAATQLIATFTATAANVNAATAGACTITVLFEVLP